MPSYGQELKDIGLMLTFVVGIGLAMIALLAIQRLILNKLFS